MFHTMEKDTLCQPLASTHIDRHTWKHIPAHAKHMLHTCCTHVPKQNTCKELYSLGTIHSFDVRNRGHRNEGSQPSFLSSHGDGSTEASILPLGGKHRHLLRWISNPQVTESSFTCGQETRIQTNPFHLWFLSEPFYQRNTSGINARLDMPMTIWRKTAENNQRKFHSIITHTKDFNVQCLESLQIVKKPFKNSMMLFLIDSKGEQALQTAKFLSHFSECRNSKSVAICWGPAVS